VDILNEKVIDSCLHSFPNTIELTLSDCSEARSVWSEDDSLHCIIPLTQLTKLTINDGYRPFYRVIDILYFLPNIHTLVLKCMSLIATEFWPLQRSERFQMVSSTNKIENMIIMCDYSLHKIKLLTSLCPRLEHITIDFTFRSFKALEPTIQFLLSRTNQNTSHLSSLYILGLSGMMIGTLKTLIESDKLLDNYSMKSFDNMLLIWW
jgi:hypothetical protein